MAYSGQGGDFYGQQEESYDEADYQGNEGYTGYDYTGHSQTGTTYYGASSGYDVQGQQSGQASMQYSQQQGYGSTAPSYGSSQADYYSSASSLQRSSTPMAGGSAGRERYDLHSTAQHMMPDTQWTKQNVSTTPQYQPSNDFTSPSTGRYMTGSVMPGQDEAPAMDWGDEEGGFGEGFDYDEDEDDYDDEDNDAVPNYSTPVNTKDLPKVVSKKKQAEQMTRQEAQKRSDDVDKEAEEATNKIASDMSLKRYRDKRAWEEIYTEQKERITRNINEKSKEILRGLKAEKDYLLGELKKHDHTTCKCDSVHQYLFFTGESRHITREEAFRLGWLTAEELASLQCRSPKHSPKGKGGSGSGKPGSPQSESNADKSPTKKKSGKGKDGKGKKKRKEDRKSGWRGVQTW